MRASYCAGLLLAGGIVAVSTSAHAQIANEPWEGPNQDAITTNIGTPLATPANLGTPANGEDTGPGFGAGWAAGWVAATTDATRIAIINDPAAPLGTVTAADRNYLSFTNTDVPPVTYASGERILRVHRSNETDLLYRQLLPVVDDDSIYFAFLFKVEAGTINDNDTLYFWFDNVTGTDHENSPQVGYNANNGAGESDIVIRMQSLDTFTRSTDPAAEFGATVPSPTVYIVVNISKDIPGASNPYTTMSLWVNPNNSDLGTPEVTTTISPGFLSSFNLVGIRTEAVDTTDVYYIDGPRLGNWPDIVPPPGSPPLAVDLVNLQADREGGAVRISWSTAAELDTAGFKIVRATEHGTQGAMVTPSLIPAEGNEIGGSIYYFVDETPAVYASYYLIEVELDGTENVYGPVSVAGTPAPSSTVGNWVMY